MLTMKTFILLTLAYFLHCEGAVARKDTERVVNNRPIIGVLSQEQPYLPKELYLSYIAASYVKDIESAGARVVPIMIGKNRYYYENLMRKINGVLYPGGDIDFNQTNGYADAGQHIYEIAQELNDQGDYFPIFGTCLGLQFLIVLASGRRENLIHCDSYENKPLNFVPYFRLSKMFYKAPEEVIYSLANKDVAVNAHSFCVTDENLRKYNLTKDWRVTSRSNDKNDVEFIASIEHRRYPFYGTQFHPEKSAYEWKPSKFYAHSAEAVKTNHYFMQFFINECRKNRHVFDSVAEENRYLIYNYQPLFTGKEDGDFTQIYFFKDSY